MRHPEVARDLFPGVPALLVADHDDPLPFEARQPGDDRRVVAEDTIAVELDEVFEQQLEEVARVRALRMARQLRTLPGRQAGVGLLAEAREPVLELGDLVARPGPVRVALEGGDPVLDLEERQLEIKRVRHSPR